jgi:hypothetical protein
VGELAGWVLLGIVVLVFAYILPAAIRSRQVVVDSRAEDRYSGDLRIVATAGHRQELPTSSSRVFVHARHTTEENPMSSPADRQLAAADARRLAAARAARAAASSRRAAAARRRLALTLVLLLATAAGWAAYGVLSWPLAVGIAPTVALLGVGLLGRRAAAAGAAADARWERELASITTHARNRAESSARESGRPRLRVDVDPTALLAEPSHAGARVRHTAPATDDPAAWTPIPVPPPAYTLKQAAPRREVPPFLADQPTELMDAVDTDAPTESGSEELETREAVETRAGQQAEAETADAAPAMNVQAVLARRRAAG